MEQVRLFAAIILSIIVFVGWNFLFPPQKPVDVPQETQVEQPVAQPGEPAAAAVDIKPVTVVAENITVVESPLYRIEFTNRGAAVKRFELKKYKETLKGDAFKNLVPEGVDRTFTLTVTGSGVEGAVDALFEVDKEKVLVGENGASLTYRWVSASGVEVVRSFNFNPDSYDIGSTVTLRNGSPLAINDNLAFGLISTVEGGRTYGFEGPSGFVDGHLENVKVKKIEDKNLFKGNVEWVAQQSRYFMTAVIPKGVAGTSMALADNSGVITAAMNLPTGMIQPGGEKTLTVDILAAPKSYRMLKKLDSSVHKAVNFGWFDIIAKPCLSLMNLIHDHVIANYGIAIILLTILIKLIFWPLGNKSYTSMHEMKKLQPIMAKLREKYKDDKQRMNQEVMALYKTYKVNPMSGCLPLVVQMPIFFALYRMLYSAVELRHAPFFGWITDLSAPDRLFHFGFNIPMMAEPSGIPVLTLLMGATMFLQQKMSPSTGDPTQAKMMMMMPLVMTVIFVNFSSGLVLYWLVNNILSISQQYYITKKLS
ncbi:membrane protein insertase YidC [Desulfoluna butyratoxydans]|uniref:Membrane protein insertase YidC n=1 Tax=Desulfoluna butyratoxydans TaxID=231438 RepID=A0A4U8YRA6_9BACT|nr:membrane protein insertase YidC [Desulfoluna butyratoxydans]VFQ43793.1 membrane insertase oxa1/alb3/yidc [Desulfoluna butyratoxydans]